MSAFEEWRKSQWPLIEDESGLAEAAWDYALNYSTETDGKDDFVLMQINDNGSESPA